LGVKLLLTGTKFFSTDQTTAEFIQAEAKTLMLQERDSSVLKASTDLALFGSKTGNVCTTQH
jgi:hypothetical protein